MLALAEYIAASAGLYQLGHAVEQRVAEHVNEETKQKEAIRIAKNAALYYDEEYGDLLDDTSQQVADNAVKYYNTQLGLNIDTDSAVSSILERQAERYFGLTLTQRLLLNRKRLDRQITQTAAIDPMKLTGVWTEPVPFGAHISRDRRLLLGTLVKIEHDAAKHMAKEAQIPFLRWMLSHKHVQEDECDDRANYVDPAVVKYIQDNNLDLDPTGLYFAEELPLPPHPNCQCEYHLVSEHDNIPHTRVRKALRVIRKLLRKIKAKRAT